MEGRVTLPPPSSPFSPSSPFVSAPQEEEWRAECSLANRTEEEYMITRFGNLFFIQECN